MAILEDGQQYEGATFTALATPAQTFTGIDFAACVFDRCVFTESAFSHCSFTDCRFTGCDLSLARVPGSRFTDTRFDASKLLGVDWTKAGDAVISKLFLSVHFDDCLLNYATFFGLALRRSRFTDCIAREVDFRDADLTEAVCTTTDFTGSKFHHTNLTKADFRRATGYAINPATNTVTRARFSLPEAVSLLSGFDIVIE
ncbi:MAG: pentapeptide repeat-containing protein [Chloroflexota bacterium]|nr:pentapeptide repeat-containing protein [Chloroflexota bacterium]